MNRLLSNLLAAIFTAGLVAGCGFFGSKDEYKGAQARTVQPLEVPPELTSPTIDDRYAIPDPKAQTSYSAYSQRPAAGPPAAGSAAGQVLPPIEGARLERQGDQRWLVVKGEPAAVWPVVREFWIESGFTLAKEEPNAGILETDWLDDKSKIPQDVVRNTLGKVVPNLWQSARRDKYRTRLEKGSDLGTTEVFVSNRQVEEVWADSTQTRTAWQNKPADREAEAEMLQKIMIKMGSAQAKAAAQATAVAAKGGTPAAPAAPESSKAQMKGNDLVVNDNFERTWRRVGLALDRVGFTVEDRDRSKGLFFVRYIDPEADASAGKKEEGWTDKLKFWKTSPKNQPQFRILVSDAGASVSQVQVQDAQGAADQTGTGKKILTLLYDQLK
jgi:outer membrane protein assembly factor BamC